MDDLPLDLIPYIAMSAEDCKDTIRLCATSETFAETCRMFTKQLIQSNRFLGNTYEDFVFQCHIVSKRDEYNTLIMETDAKLLARCILAVRDENFNHGLENSSLPFLKQTLNMDVYADLSSQRNRHVAASKWHINILSDFTMCKYKLLITQLRTTLQVCDNTMPELQEMLDTFNILSLFDKTTYRLLEGIRIDVEMYLRHHDSLHLL